MTQTDFYSDQQLEQAIQDAHTDQLRRPDPSGRCLLRLLGAIETHVREESASIEAYARIRRETSDPVVAAVMELLVEDENRHHTLLKRIAASLKDRLNWALDSSALPLGFEPAVLSGPETIETVRALEVEERQGAQLLRDVAHGERTGETGLPCLLLETMAMDSEKHARLLAFVAEHLAKRCM